MESIRYSFDLSSLETFSKMYSLEKSHLLQDNHLNFRLTCFHFNRMMRHIELPKITRGNQFEAVFIEFRQLIHVEFLIRNSILKLGTPWSFTIVCGKDN